MPPLDIQTKVNRIKHFLKLNIHPSPDDKYKLTIKDSYDPNGKSPPILHNSLKEVFQFLNWKFKHYPLQFSDSDNEIISSSSFHRYGDLSIKSCSYTKTIINGYTESLWSSHLKNKYQVEGYSRVPNPKCSPLPIPHGTPRDLEVKMLNFLYKHNITNSFLYTIGKSPTPICRSCNLEEDTISHLLLSCQYTHEEDKVKMRTLITSNEIDDITTINLSRNPEFVKTLINIAKTQNLPSDINVNVQYT